jgi:hypothetical protein
MILCVHLNMKVNRQTTHFLIKRTLRCPYYHSLYVFVLTLSMYLSLKKERKKEWGQSRVLPIIESRTTITLTNQMNSHLLTVQLTLFSLFSVHH